GLRALRGALRSPLFPYTTLFRSGAHRLEHHGKARLAVGAVLATLDVRVIEADEERRVVLAMHVRGVPRDGAAVGPAAVLGVEGQDRKSTRLNSSHVKISYAVFCL